MLYECQLWELVRRRTNFRFPCQRKQAVPAKGFYGGCVVDEWSAQLPLLPESTSVSPTRGSGPDACTPKPIRPLACRQPSPGWRQRHVRRLLPSV